MAGSNERVTEKNSSLRDEDVRDYLKQHNDFLERNPDMLDYLHISHASGSAISLVEKQVSVLRERNIDMRRRLKNLTANARDNDKLYEQTRSLVLKLVEANSIDELYHAFEKSMKSEFEVEHCTMVLFGEAPTEVSDCRYVSTESAKIEIGPLLKGRKAVCGPLRKEELGYLFPASGDVGSAALMPLHHDGEIGLIAVGSSDANRYSSSMGTLFLSHIADVLVRLLPRLEQ